MNKKYRIGMYGGKFMPFHKGHNYCVEFAARECETVYVILFYGCADEEKILKEHPEWWLSLEEREKQMLKICDKNAHLATIIPCLIDVIRLRTADGEEDWDAETPLVRNILGNQLAFKYFRIIQHIMSQKTHYSHSIVETLMPRKNSLPDLKKDGEKASAKPISKTNLQPIFRKKFCRSACATSTKTTSTKDKSTEFPI